MHRGLSEVVDARVMYIDMNSFFASCEQQANPSLRGKPVAVVSHAVPRGTVLAASYEAKAVGVKTGMRVADAKERCPRLFLVEPRGNFYKDIHLQIMQIIRDVCGPEMQVRSIDEAAVYLPPNWRSSATARYLAATIKARIAAEVGEYVKCSIGIAPNSLLAKVATDMQKPDGLTEITLANLEEMLGRLNLTDLPGVAERNAVRLAAHNILTPLDFYHAASHDLATWFGMWGPHWWWRLHGYEVDEYWGANPLKTMSHEHVLKHWIYSRAELVPIIHKMSERLIHRLRRNQFVCGGLSLSVRGAGGGGASFDHRFDQPTADFLTLFRTLSHLADQLPAKPLFPYRKINLVFWNLAPAANGRQLDLFLERERGESLSRSLEIVRKKHGYRSISLGTTLSAGKSVANQQLGFGRVKDNDSPGMDNAAIKVVAPLVIPSPWDDYAQVEAEEASKTPAF